MGSFVNNERKAIMKASVSATAKKAIASVVIASHNEDFKTVIEKPIGHVDKQFVDAYRTVNAQAEMLNANIQLITNTEASGVANERVKRYLLNTGAKIRDALAKFLITRGDESEAKMPRKINDFLIEETVPTWVFLKLTTQKLQLGAKDSELRKVLFPKDPSKGLSLSLKELRDVNLLDTQGGMLDGLNAFRGLWTDDVLSMFLGIPINEFREPGSAQIGSLMNVPFMVPPFAGAVTPDELVACIGKNGERGVAWGTGILTNPREILRFLGTIPKRIAYGLIGGSHLTAFRYERLFKGFRFDRYSSERQSLFAQLQAQYRDKHVDVSFLTNIPVVMVHDDAFWQSVFDALDGVLPVRLDTDEMVTVRSAIRKHGSRHPILQRDGLAEPKRLWDQLISRRQMSDEDCNGTLKGVLATNLEPKSKNLRPMNVSAARSGMTDQGKSLLRGFQKRGYHALAKRMDIWLRSFLTEQLQATVADVLAAQIEASLSPIQFGREDFAPYMETNTFGFEDEGSDIEPSDEEAVNPDDM